MPEPVLLVANLRHRFGALKVTDDVSFTVERGEILGVIGPNGAGKTTLFALLAGNMPPADGRILFEGVDVTMLPLHKRTRAGIARTHQVPRPFSHMSVFDNLRVAGLFGGSLSSRDTHDHVRAVLAATSLERVASTRAGALPLLLRKRLELARALATRPKLLLIDEIAAGLTDPEVEDFIGLVETIRAGGIAVVWIEHVLRTMRRAADRVLALSNGAVLAIGTADEVLNAPAVRRGYLGV